LRIDSTSLPVAKSIPRFIPSDLTPKNCTSIN
jgi:hypothetical protein